MKKKALILGIGGMDGSHLTDILLDKDYDVHGVYRRSSYDNLSRISHALNRITLHRGDLSDGGSIDRIIREVNPDEIYNEADQDHVGFSRETPEVSVDITAGAVQRLLETVLRFNPKIKVFQPVSATMFASSNRPLNETSPIAPASPYACAKVAAYYLCQHYRREHGLFVSCGIMFNHESPRRGPDYLLQRIVREARDLGQVHISNPTDLVDIGYAPDYMCAAYQMLQLDKPVDLVIGTSVGISVYNHARCALELCGYEDVKESIIVRSDNKFKNAPILISNIDKSVELLGNYNTLSRRELIEVLL